MSYFLIGLFCGFLAAWSFVVIVVRLINWWSRRTL